MADPNTMGEAVAALNQVASAHENLQAQFIGKQNEIEQNNQAMQDWQTQLGTVDFINPDGSVRTVKTLRQLMADAQMQIDETHPHPYAMRKSTFEALRAVNNEMFAASGFVHFGMHNSANSASINEGLQSFGSFLDPATANLLLMGRNKLSTAGDCKSKSECAIINIAGVTTKIITKDILDYHHASIKFPPPEDGSRTFDTLIGQSVKHSSAEVAFASVTDTNKVVTDRVDMWGFEVFLREINENDPYVYAYGLIQSELTKIDSVPTQQNLTRPKSYFAWYKGDEATIGRGVNWLTASESQRKVIAKNPDNNIFFDDDTGKFYQWSVAGCSFAGNGNGDWWNLTSMRTGQLQMSSSGINQRLPPKGNLDVRPENGGLGQYYAATLNHQYNPAPHLGVFTAQPEKTYGEECYFLVCGTVNRLNQGAYHPSFNPLGTKLIKNKDIDGGATWDDESAHSISEKKECFVQGSASTPGYQESTGGIGQVSGRPDERSFDAIYSSGQGGVCIDMRYSAWGVSQAELFNKDFDVKRGAFRGRELLTSPLKIGIVPSISSQVLYFDGEALPEKVVNSGLGERVLLRVTSWSGVVFTDEYQSLSSGDWHEMLISNHPSSSRLALIIAGKSPRIIESGEADNLKVDIMLIGSKMGYLPSYAISVSGLYNHMEVVASPTSVMMCNDLKDGWIGTYTKPHQGSIKLSRPVSAHPDHLRYFSDDYGVTWSKSSVNIDVKSNVVSSLVENNNFIEILMYKTMAVMTRSAANNRIYNSTDSVFSTAYYHDNLGRLFNYSLTKNVANGEVSNGGPIVPEVPLLTSNIRPLSLTLDDIPSRECEHAPIKLASQSSPGMKALTYFSEHNSQVYIYYAFTELVHSEIGWGDDSKIHISDYETTMLDENGCTVLVGTACTIEPLGWVKNDK
ncbi:hypothetical protein [Pseudoalteromonas peptidolytica]|uniref:Uncharacterized protein n=1 Tax=Pseudoalteromonas peptidolytica F12-50-A1 TaxID=1315280 RepID=A0A8I0MZF1_9GAMM|nr:hypothetical protein [Pseudoalteromonas peptidolytica]MBE0348293.1 hypothetical protein [Pseudoalteromonas peptidolytica F12-50-A1]NLR16577.1 hypothetical protein [Pseudoalteromonas peptidolytica]GEK08947.1 lambda phage protein of known function [Pseudoalteromonas peptidolytica]